MAAIPSAHLADLDAGTAEARTLAECLAVDQPALARAMVGDETVVRAAAEGKALGISRQMAAVGAALAASVTAQALERLAAHPSDTVRGWAAFAIGQAGEGVPLERRLEAQRRFAADGHFGVREWAWLAVRPFLLEDMGAAIAALVPWTADPDPNIRRFAVEATRPRGVWCGHCAALKRDPAPGLPLLEPLRADPARYVQDSVANWLNDAAKTAPDWVRAVCAGWDGGGNPATTRIIRRAMRSLPKG